MSNRFAGRVALVTGGTSGIGYATAMAFAKEGATAVLAARSSDRGEEAVASIRNEVADGGVGFVRTDVTDPESCARCVESALAAYGRLDVLVNNAGVIVRDRTVVETTPAEWDLTFDVNVKGTYLMSRAAIPAMFGTLGENEESAQIGAIVNNASYLGLVGARRVAAYAAAKGAIVNLTRAMALDHAEEGIRVNCVAPGSVETPMLRKEWVDMGGEDAVRHLFEEKHPMRRISQPEEIARVILFLASEDASFVNGACVPVDAGLTAG